MSAPSGGLAGRMRLARGAFLLDAELAAPARGITAVFGPSGSGKTTLLRCLAGLERAAGGWLEVGGERWQDDERGLFLPPHRRALGYVFQEAGLFSHLAVRQNLEFGLRRTPPAERRVSFADAVEWLELGGLLHRRTDSLSGGERQRVAMARALLAGPRLLLMDEPLAALDASAKAEILRCLERLHAELAIPFLYVSHLQDEVLRLADHLVLLAAGRVRAAGPLAEIAARLDLLPWAPEAELAVVIEARVVEHDVRFELTYLDFAGGRLSLPRQELAPGSRQRVRVLARDVSLALERPLRTSVLNVFPARIVEIGGGAQPLVKLDAGGASLLAQITGKSLHLLALRPGIEVFAVVKGVALAV
ncbi:MAG TPA: molybdenum ABC transporter ATP-binding protein [Thermoanaerobaculia bacterium]|nr:molybdenum ABC transporter ATP-binding protein [Thermoanaerobaculia bacterium]